MNDVILKKELDFFNKNKSEYLKLYKGSFVLIKVEELDGSYTTEEEAYKAGIEKYGNQPFLIKQVLENETPASFPALTVGLLNAHI